MLRILCHNDLLFQVSSLTSGVAPMPSLSRGIHLSIDNGFRGASRLWYNYIEGVARCHEGESSVLVGNLACRLAGCGGRERFECPWQMDEGTRAMCGEEA